jgi:hypothetical protein
VLIGVGHKSYSTILNSLEQKRFGDTVPSLANFIMDTTGTWYCPERNFNGVYWNREEERWWNMCGQGEFEPWSSVEIHSAALYGTKPKTADGLGWW